MANVNMAATAFSKLPFLQVVTNIPHPTLIGHLILLWNFSQDLGRVSGSQQEICEWAFIFEKEELFIKGLLKAGFIREIPSESGQREYLIRGNAKHIQSLRFYKERAKKAAAKRWSARQPKEIKSEVRHAPGMLEACSKNAPSYMQYNTMQYNTLQYSPIQIQKEEQRESVGKMEPSRPPKRKTNFKVGIHTDYPHAFQELWVKYGKRGDKKAALEVWKMLGLSEIEIAALERAITQYVKNEPELKYRKHFCRFLKTDWREVEADIQQGNENWLENQLASSQADSWTERETSHG